MRYPTNKKQHLYMKNRQLENKRISTDNPNENWMFEKLKMTGLKWSRQAQWGYRLFDFWSHTKGIAIEVDGPSHEKQKEYDSYRDKYNYRISGILVIRVKNKDEDSAKEALKIIAKSEKWKDRRMKLGLKNTGRTFNLEVFKDSHF